LHCLRSRYYRAVFGQAIQKTSNKCAFILRNGKIFKSIFTMSWLHLHFLFSSNYAEVNISNCKWVPGGIGFLYICEVNSLHDLLPPLAFPNTIAVELCVWEVVRLIWHVVTNHVNCVELPALWLSSNWNYDLCQSASKQKEVIWCSFRRITHYCESNSNSKSNRELTMITYFEFK